MTQKKKKKQILAVSMTETPPPADLVNGVDKACSLILECLDMNKVTKSEGVSAMASLIVSILSNYESPNHFHQVIKMMEVSFRESRKSPHEV